MNNKLLVGVLGNKNSGKSETWYTLFEEQVSTGTKIRKLYLTNTKYVEVFLINGSPEERGIEVEDIIGNNKPTIVLCSMQYIPDVKDTIDYFVENAYSLYIQWLNPGFHDQSSIPCFDNLGLMNYLLSQDAILSIRDGKKNANARVQDIVDYLYGWASLRNILFSDPE